jgi:hypothetical protein
MSHHERTLWPAPFKPEASWPKARVVSDLRWQNDAACSGVGDEVSERLVEATLQKDVADLVARLCRRCPVAASCLQTGRDMRADGTWGGVVLVDGRERQAASA